jgi:hypothetical protein
MYKTLNNIENTPIKKVDIMNININDKVIIHYKSYILIEDIHFKYDNKLSYEENFKIITENL